MRSRLLLAPLALVLLSACDDAATGVGGDGGASSSSTSSSATSSTSSNASTSSSASTSSTTSSGPSSTSSTSTSGGGCSTTLSDEFDDACTLANWMAGPNQAATSFDIHTTTPGRFTVEPTQSGWYQENHAFLLSKPITGDFVVQIDAEADSRDAPGNAPNDAFNSIGVLARDPASGPGHENWIMWDVGTQDTTVGSEGKTTVNSVSTLFVVPGGRRGELALCRLGTTFHLLRRLEGDAGWSETHTFDRPDMPATLDVGLITNAWESAPDLHATVDYVRFGVPATLADCTAALPPAHD